MKKTITVILAVLMVILMCGCGEKAALNPSKKVPASEKADSSGADSGEAEPEDDVTAEWVIEGEAVSNNAMLKLGFNPSEIDSVEWGTSVPTLQTPWDNSGTVKSSKTDAAAEALRNQILNAKNTLENYHITGTVYYVSPNGNDDNDGKSPETAFRTVKSLAFTKAVQPGDAVLFERGGVWRLSESIRAREGVTYGAYGTGEKPALYMSPYNYARSEFWLPSTRENIWKVSATDTDIGLVVFNHGEIVGVKKDTGIIALEKNGDYYYNSNQDMLYLYYDGGNPGKAFDDIEIGFKKAIISVSRVKNVTIDNLKLKYSGSMAVSLCNSDNSIITNCEAGFIGGSYQNASTKLRFGNAFQQWNSVINQKFTHNWVYQVYDTGISWQGDYSWTQGNDPDRIDQYIDIDYSYNLIEYCSLSIEFWHASENDTDKSNKITRAPVKNFTCTNNICRFAGYGWGRQRTDHSGYHICVFSRAFANSENNFITDNLFDLCDSYIVRWDFMREADNVGWTIRNNTYYQKKNLLDEGVWYGTMRTATSQGSLDAAVRAFDKDPKHIEWIDG